MKAIAIKLGNVAFIFHGITVDDIARILLLEKYAGKHQLPKGYDIRHDIAHIPGCQDHIHVDRKGRMLGAFNLDGSPHDNSNFRIPRIVADYVTQRFPNFNIPDGRFVEALSFDDQGVLLLLEDIKKSKKFEQILVIDLDEIGITETEMDSSMESIELDDKQKKLIEELFDSMN